MDLTVNLYMTLKGEDEVKRRLYRLGVKKRSLLIMLDRPKPAELLVSKSVLPREEAVEEIETLIRDGFVTLSGSGAAQPTAAPVLSITAPIGGVGMVHLNAEVVLAEAKFMLYDFCVDNFGTKSQVFVDRVRASNSVPDLENCLRWIVDTVEARTPERVPALVELINAINATA